MTIPREDGLVRFYVQLDDIEDCEQSRREVGAPAMLGKANAIMSPYELSFNHCDWSTCYQIGHRLASQFSITNAVFMCGDAVHTVSPKAGQGMNTSIQDAYNLGWKIAAVARGLADPQLLQTYAAERYPVAQRLIEFDRWLCRHFVESPRLRLRGSARASCPTSNQRIRGIRSFRPCRLKRPGAAARHVLPRSLPPRAHRHRRRLHRLRPPRAALLGRPAPPQAP